LPELLRSRERDAIERCADFRKIRTPCIRQHDASIQTFEQRLAEPGLQLLYMPADRTVRDAQFVGGEREATQSRGGLECA